MSRDARDGNGAGPDPGAGGRRDDDRVAADLRGFGPFGVAAIAAILAGNSLFQPLSAILVLLWGWRSRTPWREIGYVRPASWARTVVVGIAFGAAFKLLMKSVVMPLLGAPPINASYHHLAGNTAALPGILFAVLVFAGWGEETFFRGYLFERLGRLLGTGAWAKAVTVLLASALFGIAHYAAQGLPGVQQATVTGLVFGAVYARTGRLPVLMVAHAAFDVMAVALIYWNLETSVAGWFFR